MMTLTRFQRNNPNQVISFTTFLHAEAARRQMAIVLLTHPPKDRSSPFAGPEAWNFSVRNVVCFNMPQTWDPARPHEGAEERVLFVSKNNNLPYNHFLKTTGVPLKWDDDGM